MYLAADPAMVENLRACQQVQSSLGAGTRLMTPEQIAAEYPFYVLDDIVMGSHNPKDEGYFDGGSIFDWFKRMVRRNGVDYCHNSVVDIPREGGRVTGVTLASGQSISAGVVVNASGPRASLTAQMAGLDVPVEPRRRYTFIFDAEKPLDQVLPLTIDPSGCHMRQDGRYYLCGCPPDEDPTVDHDDFYLDHAIWEEKLWPTIAARVPAFEAVKVVNSWVGHYAYNTLDQNAIIGFHPEVSNFLFLNGFSGHGLQQSPAMGRAAAELIGLGRFETLDMTELGYERILAGRPFLERAVI
jgi:glycine/D-amino acid oxidase-like deaminating enzyme